MSSNETSTTAVHTFIAKNSDFFNEKFEQTCKGARVTESSNRRVAQRRNETNHVIHEILVVERATLAQDEDLLKTFPPNMSLKQTMRRVSRFFLNFLALACSNGYSTSSSSHSSVSCLTISLKTKHLRRRRKRNARVVETTHHVEGERAATATASNKEFLKNEDSRFTIRLVLGKPFISYGLNFEFEHMK